VISEQYSIVTFIQQLSIVSNGPCRVSVKFSRKLWLDCSYGELLPPHVDLRAVLDFSVKCILAIFSLFFIFDRTNCRDDSKKYTIIVSIMWSLKVTKYGTIR